MKYQSPLTLATAVVVNLLVNNDDRIHQDAIIRLAGETSIDFTRYVHIKLGKDASSTIADYVLYPGDSIRIKRKDIDNSKLSIFASHDGLKLYFNFS